VRPRLLDLFCGAGGAAMGYHRAGFDVVGVDIKPQPRYPFEFHQGDALVVLAGIVDGSWGEPFDAIHASPPCQRWLQVPFALGETAYPDLISPTRRLLKEQWRPWVIENVPAAPLDGFVLCGSSFGLPIVRHRRFEMEPRSLLAPSACRQSSWDRATDHPGTHPYAHGAWRPAWREHVLPVVWPWLTLEEAAEAIPPAYTEWIGTQLLASLRAAA